MYILWSSQIFKIKGNYNLIYMASTNPNKTVEGGEFDVYMREIKYFPESQLFQFAFYFKYNGKCLPRYAYADRKEGSLFIKNLFIGLGPLYDAFQPVYVTEDTIIGLYSNVNLHGIASMTVELFTRSTSVTQEEFDIFLDFVRQQEILEENLVYVSGRDNCPVLSPTFSVLQALSP
ncbi:allergen Bos d 2-like [Tenrec ecaudatus]|uniref:allergen Bos d 2-like n=1 Tax=Tenrec ecaudatus TaxID=94439 RepID=UPI003F5956BD